MTTVTVVVRRNVDDYLTVSVEADVTLRRDTVEIDHLSYREPWDEFAGIFPVTQRELEMFERALEEEAKEEQAEALPFYWEAA